MNRVEPTESNNKIRRPSLYTREQAAKYLGISPGTLRVWAHIKRYNIPYRKIGKKVEYLKADLDDFIKKRTRCK